jgi:alkylhydroperoxidase/carboxymuconolactone decarboxylase family protein YurZ
MDVLSAELTARGIPQGPAAASSREPRPAWFDAMAAISPEWTDALANLLDTAERCSSLAPVERALIRLALAASPTHLCERAVRTEVREALDLAATPEEIAQVFQLVAHLGLHACSEGVPAVLRAAAALQGE